ncbi:RNA ligase [Microterricola gilva]|uniref:RNA ligase n=1 Tax=Microterricola gilva TaxID=393267 RepID=A0A4V2GAN1_9MICO|nr:RNA ligase family protein [Microterricola gilva]RZU64896.1 RNA ligase [Microterricola gilva]
MTEGITFEAFPKIARLNRGMVITEKLDGTNAAVVITEAGEVGAQSRNRLITPDADNYGFAGWVDRNAAELRDILGPGRHFGEWWGSGIQRKYGLTGGDKRFSLFNTGRWSADELVGVEGLGIVPVLAQGQFDNWVIAEQVERLRTHGSVAAPGFMKPEGVVVFQSASRTLFKVTVDGDEAPKGAAGHALDEERPAA